MSEMSEMSEGISDTEMKVRVREKGNVLPAVRFPQKASVGTLPTEGQCPSGRIMFS
jgi:hypothetical protein